MKTRLMIESGKLPNGQHICIARTEDGEYVTETASWESGEAARAALDVKLQEHGDTMEFPRHVN